ncbi:hypothetical protein DF133_34520 [Burkholderia cenocepacia]|nr:hypothetical protein DF133_34520 [Burkholderia cenocepacia]
MRVSGFHRGPQQWFELQSGRIYSCSPSCSEFQAKLLAKGGVHIHYNEKHPHSALKYRSPREFRRSMDSATLV